MPRVAQNAAALVEGVPKARELTQAELPHLEANHLELRTVMLCPEVCS